MEQLIDSIRDVELWLSHAISVGSIAVDPAPIELPIEKTDALALRVVGWWELAKSVWRELPEGRALDRHDVWAGLVSGLTDLLGWVLLPRLKDLSLRRKLSSMLGDLDKRGAQSAAVWPAIVDMDKTQAEATARIRKAILGGRRSEVRAAMSAICLWVHLQKRNHLDRIPTSLLDLAIDHVQYRTIPGMEIVLIGMPRVVASLPDVLPPPQVERLCDALAALEAGVLADDDGVGLRIPAPHSWLRASAAALAGAIAEAEFKAGRPIPAKLEGWRLIGKESALPEFRRPWAWSFSVQADGRENDV
jgi:hypothetical protein